MMDILAVASNLLRAVGTLVENMAADTHLQIFRETYTRFCRTCVWFPSS
jgi:hypothetical protein